MRYKKASELIRKNLETGQLLKDIHTCGYLSELLSLYGLSSNGEARKIVRKACALLGFTEEELQGIFANNRLKRLGKLKKCPNCSIEFIADDTSTVCCSWACGNVFFKRPQTEETKEKIRTSIQKHYVAKGITTKIEPRECKTCHNIFTPKKVKTSVFCSRVCRCKDATYTQKLRESMLRRVANGTHSGWKTRAGKQPSYAEKFFMRVLEANGIAFERELPCAGFFIDFALKDYSVALEIDGKQHKLPNRLTSDLRKDKALYDAGWLVYRIPWKSVNTDSGKQYMKKQIDDFLAFIR